MARVKHNEKAWKALKEDVLQTDGVRRMRRVAAAANAADGLTDGYMVSVDGDDKLRDRDKVTVITATAKAMAKNEKHDTLRRAFNAARD